MKILWLMNGATSRAAEKLNMGTVAIVGWADVLCSMIVNCQDVDFCGVFPQQISKETLCYESPKESYYAYFESREPRTSYCYENEKYFREIISKESPDIVHIWGTEYSHSLEMVNAFDMPQNTIISIQGLISVYSNHYYADLPWNIINRFTIRDFLKRDNIKIQKSKYQKRGKFEVTAISKVDNVIGRTTWDLACVKTINPEVRYFYGGEILRNNFYSEQKWKYENCEKYSLFTSQAYYPIKGLHYLLKAMIYIMEKYPKSKLYIGGTEPYYDGTFIGKLKTKSYGKYIKKMIKDNKLNNNVIFLGRMNAEEMREQFLKSNVFVLPSAIENSPNSLGEAMILGVPCVASDVGGVKDMIEDGVEGYTYQHNEPAMLAHYICELFGDVSLAKKMGKRASIHAEKTHGVKECFTDYIEIYRKILSL